MKPLVVLVTLIVSYSSFAGSLSCYIGVGEVVSIQDLHLKDLSKTAVIEVKSFADGFGKANNPFSGYEMEIGKTFGWSFPASKSQDFAIKSSVNFACAQEFTKHGPSKRNCVKLTDSELKMSREEKFKFCSVPH